MAALRTIWNKLLLILAIIVVVDALVFFYIILFPGQPVARELSKYEPVFTLLMGSEFRSPIEERVDEPSPRGVQITVRYVEGDQMVAIPRGHPVFADPAIDAKLLGRNDKSSNRRSIAEKDGWYLLEFSFGRGWVHPFITDQYLSTANRAEENTASAERYAEQQNDDLLSVEQPPITMYENVRLPTYAERRRERLQAIFDRFDSSELALLPTSVDPDRLLSAMELIGEGRLEQRISDFVIFFTDERWGSRSASLLANLRSEYQKLLGPVILEKGARSNAFVFLLPDMASYKEFYPMARSSGTMIHAGHYEGGLMAIHPNMYQGVSRYRTLVHEATHHYNFLLLRISGAEKLTWLDEGFATYFGYSRQLESGEIVAGAFPHVNQGRIRYTPADSPMLSRRDGPESRVVMMQRKLRGANPLKIERLLTMENQAFYEGDVLQNYTQSWLFVHFLLHAEDGALRSRLYEFIRKARLNPVDTDQFEELMGMSAGEFNKRWRRYVLSL
jgi:hypothetical protein